MQGYYIPMMDTTQRPDTNTSLMQAATQTLYTAGGSTAVMPLTAYPQLAAIGGGTSVYPSQVIYSGEHFSPAGGTLAAPPAAASASPAATTQLHQLPVTPYTIGYSYPPYNGLYFIFKYSVLNL